MDTSNKRSSGTLQRRRVRLPWPKERDFRILSIDGGGIRGIFPAAFLAEMEQRHLDGESIAGSFDLIAGTSTGGIIALGLASGFTSAQIRRLYVERGCEIFPPIPDTCLGSLQSILHKSLKLLRFRYDRNALLRILRGLFGSQRLGDARTRLCIPSFEGRHGEPYIFKTPHHPDYHLDRHEPIVKVAAATSAAPIFYAPLEDGGYRLVDGGVWCNNPVMMALVDVLSCFEVPRERIFILSVGCGERPYIVGNIKIKMGGLFAWYDIMYAAMRLQSHNAIGQAGLLIGRNQLIRVDAPDDAYRIDMDDWSRAAAKLPGAAATAADEYGARVASFFFRGQAAPYKPIPEMMVSCVKNENA